MSTVDRISVELALRDAGFRAGLASNRGLVGVVERAFVGAAKRMGQALELGFKVGAVGAGVGLGFAVKAAVDFESQVGAVRKTTGLTGQALQSFTKQVEQLARTLPGVSIEDLLGAAAEGGRQGMTDARMLLDYVQTIGMMKVALDDIPIQESSNSMGKLAANYGLGTGAVRGLVSALNKLDDTSKASAREIMQAALQSSQMAHALGISADWALALSSGLVEAGMSADTAGTAFSQIIRRLSSEQETFAALAGVSTERYAAALKQGPLAALELVIRNLQQVSALNGGVAAIQDMVDAKVVDQQQTQALLSLVQTWDQLGERAQQANHEMATSESLNKEVEISGKLAAKQFGLLWNQVTLAGKAIGSHLIPAMVALSKHLGKVMDGFSKWAEGGALDGMKAKLVDLANVVGAAFNDLPGTLGLLSDAFDAVLANMKLAAIQLFEELSRMIAEKWPRLTGFMNLLGSGAGLVSQGYSAVMASHGHGGGRESGSPAEQDGRTTLEKAQDDAKAKNQAARVAFEQQKKKGQQSLTQIDRQRQAQIAAPRPPAPPQPELPQQPSRQDHMRAFLQQQQEKREEFLKQQQEQRQRLLQAQEQEVKQVYAEAQQRGRRPDGPKLQELELRHMQERRTLISQQLKGQEQWVQEEQQRAKQIPKEEEKEAPEPARGPDAPEREFARKFSTNLSLERIKLGGRAVPPEAARMAREGERKAARDELERKLQDDLKREQEGPDGKGPGPDAFKRMAPIIKGLEGIRWEKFQEARGEIGREFMRDEATRQQDRVAEMQERMFSVRSGGADDFASAVQAGIGKTGDVQKEILDYNRRQAELLDRIARSFEDVYLPER